MTKYLYLVLLMVPALSHAMEKGKAKTPDREVIEASLTFVRPGSRGKSTPPREDEPKCNFMRRFSLPSLFGKSSNGSSSSGVSKNSTNSASGDYASAPNTSRAGTPKSPKSVHFDEKRNSVQSIDNIDGERELCVSPRAHKQKSRVSRVSEEEEEKTTPYYVDYDDHAWREAAQDVIADTKEKDTLPNINKLAMVTQATKISCKRDDDDNE
jgi:hypothetical protein